MPENFQSKVEQQVDQLKRSAYREIEREVAQKRIAWVTQNHGASGKQERTSPRQAFETLFFDYMGIPADELPVQSETDTEIVWRSLNPCPTLEACQQLGYDTRQVCRGAYEKSTQAFLSQFDPQLRFLRSYEEIRPYANYCKESIIRVDFDSIMRQAIEEARASRQDGNRATARWLSADMKSSGRRMIPLLRSTIQPACRSQCHPAGRAGTGGGRPKRRNFILHMRALSDVCPPWQSGPI